MLCLAGAAFSQQPAPDDPLAAIRGRVAFGTGEDRVIDGWIAGRIDELKSAADDPDGDPVAAAGAFRAAFRSELNNAASTPRYLERLAERTAAAAVTQFAAGQNPPAVVHWALAWVLLDINRVSTRDALTAGLKHSAEPVRYLCAKTYANLRSAIAADAATTRRIIAVLQEAGAAETNGVVLGAIYRALSYEQRAYQGPVVDAMSQVFAARVRARQSGQQLRADRAELLAFNFLQRVRGNIPDAARPRLVRQLAAFLTLDVQRHSSALPDEQRVIEERIEVCEGLIEALAGRGGDVRGAMKKGGDAVEEEMALELLEWVGGEGTQGGLNSAPWNVPSGGLPK